MLRSPAIAFGILAALLGGINGLEVMLAPWSSEPAPVPAHAISAEPAGAAGDPTSAELEAHAAIVTGRPLFEPSRRPPAADAPRLSAPTLPRVTGIVSSPTARFVVFAPEGGGKPLIVLEGSRLNGFLIQRIADGQVTVVDQHGSHVLRPSFESAAAPAPGRVPAAGADPGRAGPATPIATPIATPGGTPGGSIALGQPAPPAAGAPDQDQARFDDIPGLHGRPLGLSSDAAMVRPAANPPAISSLAAPDDRSPGRRRPSLSPSGDVQ